MTLELWGDFRLANCKGRGNWSTSRHLLKVNNSRMAYIPGITESMDRNMFRLNQVCKSAKEETGKQVEAQM